MEHRDVSTLMCDFELVECRFKIEFSEVLTARELGSNIFFSWYRNIGVKNGLVGVTHIYGHSDSTVVLGGKYGIGYPWSRAVVFFNNSLLFHPLNLVFESLTQVEWDGTGLFSYWLNILVNVELYLDGPSASRFHQIHFCVQRQLGKVAHFFDPCMSDQVRFRYFDIGR